MSAATEGAEQDQVLDPPLLEAQSSFAEADNMAAAFRTEPNEPARFDPEDIMQDEDAMQDRDVFEVMFDCHIKNLVEFVDKKALPQRKTHTEV